MNIVAMKEARDNLADIVNRVAFAKERVSLTRKNKPVACLVPIEDMELREMLEDRYDLMALDRALSEDEPNVSWEDLKAEIGL